MVIAEYLAQHIDYKRRTQDPGAWFSTGISLYFAADVLWQRLRPALTAAADGAPLTSDQELDLRLKGPFAMLAGMAIEDMLKGSIIQRGSFPKGRDHRLVSLSDEAEAQLSQEEADLLRRLTTFIRWAGRYPVALSEAETAESRTLKSTDYATIAAIAGRLVKAHQQGS